VTARWPDRRESVLLGTGLAGLLVLGLARDVVLGLVGWLLLVAIVPRSSRLAGVASLLAGAAWLVATVALRAGGASEIGPVTGEPLAAGAAALSAAALVVAGAAAVEGLYLLFAALGSAVLLQRVGPLPVAVADVLVAGGIAAAALLGALAALRARFPRSWGAATAAALVLAAAATSSPVATVGFLGGLALAHLAPRARIVSRTTALLPVPGLPGFAAWWTLAGALRTERPPLLVLGLLTVVLLALAAVRSRREAPGEASGHLLPGLALAAGLALLVFAWREAPPGALLTAVVVLTAGITGEALGALTRRLPAWEPGPREPRRTERASRLARLGRSLREAADRAGGDLADAGTWLAGGGMERRLGLALVVLALLATALVACARLLGGAGC
jgi:hypothetical protein